MSTADELDRDLLEQEYKRANREASAYVGLAVLNRDRPEVDARYTRMAATMDLIADLLSDELATLTPEPR